MVEACKFTKSWDVIQAWEGSYTNSIDGLRRSGR
jgi:hypothetical protein